MDDAERLFRTYHGMLVRYLTRRLGDRDWAEEVAQETFIRALRQDRLTNERAWLFTVANNLVRDEAAHQRWGEGLREGRCHVVIVVILD